MRSDTTPGSPRAVRLSAIRLAVHESCETHEPSHFRQGLSRHARGDLREARRPRCVVGAGRAGCWRRGFAGAAAPLLAQAGSTTLAGLTFGPPIIAMLMAALQSDHAAWQIGQRRFAGLAEYVRMRWLGRSRRSSRKNRRSRRRRMSPKRRPIQENRPARLKAPPGRASSFSSLAGCVDRAAWGMKKPIF